MPTEVELNAPPTGEEIQKYFPFMPTSPNDAAIGLDKEDLLNLLNDPDVVAKIEFIARSVFDQEIFIREREEESEPAF